ncbi:MAG: ribulokinase [Christensenellaceae bacterium]|jgi:L-ribulokinase|nr:ribulokinase [Christensenellaceae bacterium]
MGVLLGVDFGTLSARAVLVSAKDGEILGESSFSYPHGVLDRELPGGIALPADWALQHPNDYLLALRGAIAGALKAARLTPRNVVGLGIDFTSCTAVAADGEGVPLCLKAELQNRPHAYPKLWKHHAAQPQADRMTALARERGEPWLPLYGGRISSECLLPKALQVLEEDPEVYAAAELFIEAGDWMTFLLTGELGRNACMAGYRALWDGAYPSPEFFGALNPGFEGIEGKLQGAVLPLGSQAGQIGARGAAISGLLPGTPVAAAVLDAHAGMAAAGIAQTGKLLLVMGTSTCHLVLGDAQRAVPGICGAVKDGMIPGFYGFEAGQSCVGDAFSWFLQNCLPGELQREAEGRQISPHALLRERALGLLPGESGLLALDWWNGSRTPLIDGDLSGVLFGLSLRTRPEEIYRALIEGSAFGTRKIIENYRENGVAVSELIASGGIAHKDPMMMQIYADVCGLPLRVAQTRQGGALGAALFAAVASGEHGDLFAAMKAMVKPPTAEYRPVSRNHKLYGKLYAQYLRLHDLFGRGEDGAVKALRAISREAAALSKIRE